MLHTFLYKKKRIEKKTQYTAYPIFTSNTYKLTSLFESSSVSIVKIEDVVHELITHIVMIPFQVSLDLMSRGTSIIRWLMNRLKVLRTVLRPLITCHIRTLDANTWTRDSCVWQAIQIWHHPTIKSLYWILIVRLIVYHKTICQKLCKRLSIIEKCMYIFCLFSVKPAAVHILEKNKYLSADKTYDIECVSSGSKPPAILSWWKETKPLKRLIKNVRIIYHDRFMGFYRSP